MTEPSIDLITSPQAGSMSTRLLTGGVEPAIQDASAELGTQLQGAVKKQRAAMGEKAPTVSPLAQEALEDPIDIDTRAWKELPDGSALGMAPFYWAIILLVAGVSGSVGVVTLSDGILGVVPMELGMRFRRRPLRAISRLATFFVRWGLVVIGAAPTVGLMMWAGQMDGLPMPHGEQLFWVSWLAISAISAAALALITLGGNIGLILAMICLIFLGLPSAGAVVPLEALPDFYAGLAKIEPLHYAWLGVRDLMFFDADPQAGLDDAVRGLSIIMLVSVAVACLVAPLWDLIDGRRGHGIGSHRRR